MIPLADWLAGKRANASFPAPGDEPSRDEMPSPAKPAQEAVLAAPVELPLRYDEAELERRVVARLDAARLEIAAELTQRNDTALAAQGEALAASVKTALHEIENSLAAAVAEALGQIAARDVVSRAHAEFVNRVAGRIGDGEMVRLRISAPEAQAAQLRESFVGQTVDIRSDATEVLEARAICDDQVIETRIRDWLIAAGLAMP